MFEIGFPELILIAIVGLLVIGPERLPEALRTMGLWLGRMRRSFNSVKAEIEKEIGMDEVKRQLHNEAIMEEMKRLEAEVKHTTDTARSTLNEGIAAARPTTPSIDPNVHNEVSDMIAAQDGGADAAEPGSTAAAEQADDRDHTDAGAEGRDHTDAGAEDRDHTDAGAADHDPADHHTGADRKPALGRTSG